MSKLDTINFKSNIVLSTTVTTSNTTRLYVAMSANGRVYAASTYEGNIYVCREGELAWAAIDTPARNNATNLEMSWDGNLILLGMNNGLINRFVWNAANRSYTKTTVPAPYGTSIINGLRLARNTTICLAVAQATTGITYRTSDITAVTPAWDINAYGSSSIWQGPPAISDNGTMMIGCNTAFDSAAWKCPANATPTDWSTHDNFAFRALYGTVNDNGTIGILTRPYTAFNKLSYTTNWSSWTDIMTLANWTAGKYLGNNKFIYANSAGIYIFHFGPTGAYGIINVGAGAFDVAGSNTGSRLIYSLAATKTVVVADNIIPPTSGRIFGLDSTALKSISPTGVIQQYA